ncbi:MAG TPA: plasmid recombination protein [Microvirga sp.]|jgi:hypothetical protein|nr:plasmid recombination protein [Microvirga sp.]
MATQFYHVSLYGRSPRKGSLSHETIAGITAEAARLPQACRHVETPREPTLLQGVSPVEAGRIAIRRAEVALDAAGRRLRRDGVALLACVISYPVPRADVEAKPEERDLYCRWREDVLGWLQWEYGTTLLSVVEHTDETYLHLHAYAVPELGPGGQLAWDGIHPGRRALSEAAARGETKSGQNANYNGAMRDLQDRFHAAVSVKYGHERVGERRRRLDRAAAKQRSEEKAREVRRRSLFVRELERERNDILTRAALKYFVPLEHARAELAEQAAEIAQLRELLRENGIALGGRSTSAP